MGTLQLSGTMSSGHTGTLMPEQMYFISDSHATLEGADLGRPARLPANPAIGHVPLPARGVFATGQAAWEILDLAEYERTRSQTAATAQTQTGSPQPGPIPRQSPAEGSLAPAYRGGLSREGDLHGP
jgi:hypothetical protein